MLVSIRDCRHSKKDRQWIQDVYAEYLDALADLNTGLFLRPGRGAIRTRTRSSRIGLRTITPIPWSSPRALTRWALPWSPGRGLPAAGETAVNYHMSEFFVRKAHRRVGIGRDAAKLIFDRFAGDWEIVEYQRNPGSVAFWRRVLTAYCKGRFTERTRNGEVHQRFTSRPAATR